MSEWLEGKGCHVWPQDPVSVSFELLITRQVKCYSVQWSGFSETGLRAWRSTGASEGGSSWFYRLSEVSFLHRRCLVSAQVSCCLCCLMSAVQVATNKVTAATTVVLHTDQCLHDRIASTYCQPLLKHNRCYFFFFCYCENKIKWVFFFVTMSWFWNTVKKKSFRFWVWSYKPICLSKFSNILDPQK